MELIFGYVLQLWIVYRLVQKETNFAILTPKHRIPQVWALLNFDHKKSKTPKVTSITLTQHTESILTSYLYLDGIYAKSKLDK